jgi:DNA repair protein RadC
MVTAQRLLSQFGNLAGIAAASIEELSKVKGIGVAKATKIKASCELANRLNGGSEVTDKPKVKSPADIAGLVGNKLRNKQKEHFLAILLDTRNQVFKISEISVGSLDTNILHPREVFKEAIAGSAASIILILSSALP